MGNIVQPIASSLVESLRAFGYSFEAAVADIIDNSIFSGAKNIWIEFSWSGQKTKLLIKDDGKGMDANELLEAMRPGTQNPLEERSADDLGRFGLGLKTASFSQCRKLIVCSKKNNKPSIRCWDLDIIEIKKDWYLLDENDLSNSDSYLSPLKNLKSGTVVYWETIDRICQDLDPSSQKHHSKFLEIINSLEFHLSMTFHRFLSLPNGPRLFLNQNPIRPWDPFMSKHDATQEKPKVPIDYKGNQIIATIFILPHHSKLSEEEYKYGQGIRGWNDHQGFYIYRNKRLLISGDWLGIGGSKEEHAKLARIRIDLPNTLDHYWHIDVKKSKAFPPPVLRESIKEIASKARSEAGNIYRHRGKVIRRSASTDDTIFVWKQFKRHKKNYFKLNIEHPSIKKIHDTLPLYAKKDFKAMLRMIGETVPSPAIAVTHSEQPDTIGRPFDGCLSELKKLGISLFDQLKKDGYSKKKALQKLACIEPFDSYLDLIDIIGQEVSNADR